MTFQNEPSPEKKQNVLWPEITSMETAREVAHQGLWASILVAIITAFFAVLVMMIGPVEGTPPVSAWSFVDVGIFVAIALGIRKMSRIAAVCGLIIYSADRIYLLGQTGSASGLVVSVLFVVSFINGVRGTFAYHRLRRRCLQKPTSDIEFGGSEQSDPKAPIHKLD